MSKQPKESYIFRMLVSLLSTNYAEKAMQPDVVITPEEGVRPEYKVGSVVIDLAEKMEGGTLPSLFRVSKDDFFQEVNDLGLLSEPVVVGKLSNEAREFQRSIRQNELNRGKNVNRLGGESSPKPPSKARKTPPPPSDSDDSSPAPKKATKKAVKKVAKKAAVADPKPVNSEALFEKCVRRVECFIEENPRTASRIGDKNIPMQRQEGGTAMHSQEAIDVARKFIDRGADVSLMDSITLTAEISHHYGEAPMCSASAQTDIPVYSLLLAASQVMEQDNTAGAVSRSKKMDELLEIFSARINGIID